MKRLIVAVVVLAVIGVMALRGCPRSRRNASVSRDALTAGVTDISRTIYGEKALWESIDS